jgi:hypothetical protein
MLECGNCTACCDGWLAGNSHGNPFGKDRSCVFLCNKECTIYKTRPAACSNYQCAWSQGLFPLWMKPTESNVLISIEIKDNNQFLKVIEMGNPIKNDILKYIEDWVIQNNTYYILIKGEQNEN